MAKTISTILQIAGLAALAVLTYGAASAALVGAPIAAGISGISSVIGVSSGLLVTGAAVGLALTFGGPSLPKPEQAEGAIKAPRSPRVSGYGVNRIYMAYALYVTDSKGTAIDVGVFHAGRVNRIIRRYLGDKQVQVDGSGWVQRLPDGQFGNGDRVRIGATLGPRQNTAFSEIVSRVPDQWTANHRGDGQVTGFAFFMPVNTKNFQDVYPQGGPGATPLSLAMELQLVYDWRDPTQVLTNPETWKWSENPILALAHYKLVREGRQPSLPLTDPGYPAELGAILQEKFNRLIAPTISYWTAAANDCDSPVPLKGVQTILAADAENGAGFIDVISATGLAAGMTIVISATGDTSLTETKTVVSVTNNGGFFTIDIAGTLANSHPQGSQVTWSSAAGNPATEPRYRTCLVHKHTDPHKAVVQSLLACCDGWMCQRGDGALVVYSGNYYEPTVTISPDWILSYSLQDGLEEENAINTIAVTYISANHDFNQVEATPWTDETDIARRGKELSQPLDNQVPSFSQARRLAKRGMAKVNAARRGNLTLTAAARILSSHRYVNLPLVDAGTEFFNGPIEITKLRRIMATGGVYIEWIEADPNIDAWNPATEEGEPAPVGNRIASAPLAAPTITSALPDFTAISDDGTGVKILIEASGPDRSDMIWYARWREVGAPSWNEAQYTDIAPGPTATLLTGFVPTSESVEVSVAYGIGDGRVSPWSDPPTPVGTATDATPPDAAGVIVLESWADAINLSTSRIARASSYRWRFFNPANLTTPIRTVVTTTPAVSYTSAQAVIDGIRRDYVVTLAGVNAAGAGTEASTPTLTLPAPAAVTGVTATGGASNAEVDFDLSTDPLVTGYVVATSTIANFDPMTQGFLTQVNGSPAYLQGLAAGTFYTKVAARDAWTNRPNLLNFSGEQSFVITTGGGGTGGGGGGGGGGYCVTTDTLVLMADGSEKPAGELEPGDMVRTQHELTLAWGDFEVIAVEVVEDDVFAADIGIRRMRATAGHLMWIGGAWVRMDAIGVPAGRADVVKITVDDAHTYWANGILNHNIKKDEP